MAEGSAGAAAGAPSGGEGQAASAAQAVAEGTQAAQETTGQVATEQAAEVTTEQADAEKKISDGEKKLHKYSDRLTKYFPDRKFESEEDADAAFDEYLSDHETYRKRGDESNAKLISFFDANPLAAKAINDSMTNGIPFAVSMARHFGPEDFTIEEGDDRYSDFEENVRLRNEDLEKKRAFKEQFETNQKESEAVLEKFAQENEVPPEELRDVLTQFDSMLAELQQGKVTPDSLQRILKAVRYEQAVQDAAEGGELKGKNQKISAEMQKDDPKGDGMPAPKKGGDVKDTTKDVPMITQIRKSAQNRDVLADARRERDKK